MALSLAAACAHFTRPDLNIRTLFSARGFFNAASSPAEAAASFGALGTTRPTFEQPTISRLSFS